VNRAARLAAVILLLAGCGVPSQDRPTKLDDNHVRVAAPSTTTTGPHEVGTQPVEVCLIAGDHLVESPASVTAPASVPGTLDALVDMSRTALPEGTRSAINTADLLTAHATQHGVANIDLNAKFLDILPADQILAIAQIVCTLTALPGIGQVRFTQAGHPTDVPRADSSLTNQPVSRDDYQSLLAPTPP
jgi:hypothetical protein